MRPFVSRAVSGAVAVFAIVVGFAATAIRAEIAVPPPEPMAFDLYLEVSINGISTGRILPFRRSADGSLRVAGDLLEAIGLRVDGTSAGPDGLIDLRDLSGVSAVYDEPGQAIDLIAADAARITHLVDAGHATPPATPTIPGAVLNYRVSLGVGGGAGGGLDASLSALLEPRLFGPFGRLDGSFAVLLANGEPVSAIRLETAYSRSNIDRMTTLTVGDAISGGFDWTRPIRFGGIQLRRNFDLRPDLVLYPLPAFAGSAAVPSTLDVYVNDTLRLSEGLPAGPFEIVNLPVVTGAGEARLVLRDAAGRETISVSPFFASPQLLRPGLFDFSIEAGFPRLAYGSESFAYAPFPIVSGTIRFGVTERLTAQGHLEAGPGLLNGGFANVLAFGRSGLGSLAIAGSVGPDSVGAQLAGTIAFDAGPFRVAGSFRQTFGSYSDLGSLTPRSPVRTRLRIVFPIRNDFRGISQSGCRCSPTAHPQGSDIPIAWRSTTRRLRAF